MSEVLSGEARPPSFSNEVRRLAALAFPIALSMAGVTLIGAVDTIMISPLGTVELAAASVTTSVLIIFYSALYGFVSATGVRMAEAQGKGSADALSDATRSGLLIAGISGVIGAIAMLALRPILGLLGQPPEVLAVLGGYWTAMSLLLIPFTLFFSLRGLFDAINTPWIGVWLALVAVGLNVPANLILIHGVGAWPGFGLLGAGLASLISQTASLLLAWLLWRRARLTQDARKPVRPSRPEVSVQLREGGTIAVGYIGEGGAYALALLMMGWFGAVALAANQIVTSIAGVLYMFPLGVAVAASVRVGQAVGAEERYRLPQIGRASLAVIVTWMALVMVAMLVVRGVVSNALSDDPAVIALSMSLFVLIAAMQIVDGVQGTMLGAARGMMDNRIPVAITLFSYWIVALPTGYFLGFWLDWGPEGIWVGYGAGLSLAAATITWRYFSKSRS